MYSKACYKYLLTLSMTNQESIIRHTRQHQGVLTPQY